MVEVDDIPQDAAYSDEEFGSDHEYEGGDDDFDNGDVVVDDKVDVAKQNNPVEADEEDADNYGGEFEEDEPTTAGLQLVENAAPEVAVVDKHSLENAETYDGEFDQDEADTEPPKMDNLQDTFKPSVTGTDSMVAVPQRYKETGDVLPDAHVLDGQNKQNGARDDSEAEYSNDLEDDVPITMQENTSRPRDSSDATSNLTQRRSSVPTPGTTRLSEDFPPNILRARADSMPSALPTTPLDKWSATAPRELSPEKHDRLKPQAACLPVVEEPENVIDEGSNIGEEADGNGTESDTERLPSVKEIHADEETADPYDQEEDDTYSDDGGEDSQESEHETNTAKAAKVETSSSGSMDTHENIADDHSATSPVKTTAAVNDLGSGAAPGEKNSLKESDTTELAPSQNDDNHADEINSEYPSDSNTPQFEGEVTPYKSRDETNDYDVDGFIEEGGRETEVLLQEACTLLKLQQDESESHGQQSLIPKSEIMLPGAKAAVDPGQTKTNDEKNEDSRLDNYAPRYDDDDEFAEAAEVPNQEHDAHNGIEQYELDTDDYEEHDDEASPLRGTEMAIRDVSADKDKTTDPAEPQRVEVTEELPTSDSTSTNNSTANTGNEDPVVIPNETSPLEEPDIQASLAQPPKLSPPVEPPSTIPVTKQNKPSAESKEPPKPTRPEQTQASSRATRPKKSVSVVDHVPKQPSQPVNPSRPATNRTATAPSSPPSSSLLNNQASVAPRCSRSKLTTAVPDNQTPIEDGSAVESNSHEPTAPSQSPKKQQSPPKTSNKVSSPRLPSKSCLGPYQYLPDEYPELPRKEPVPRQKVRSKPGEHGGKQRLLQPVRKPANLRFNLPEMDKTKRDWLFVNMFRHGDDLTKYEAFVPPTLLAKPPSSSHPKETKKRPLSARQVYGKPHTARFVSPSRKLVPRPNSEMQDRERNWVATTPHDSKLPAYDSILDKFCTTVTSPMVQRQIYQTRHRDLSPQLAFVLEKRVEKQCRNGYYDSFGGVSSSYKTEVVPTSSGEDSRPRQMSSRSDTKSGMLERHATSPIAE